MQEALNANMLHSYLRGKYTQRAYVLAQTHTTSLLKICLPITGYQCIHDSSVSFSSYSGSLPLINNFIQGTYSEEDICLMWEDWTQDDWSFCLSDCRIPNPCHSPFITPSPLIPARHCLWLDTRASQADQDKDFWYVTLSESPHIAYMPPIFSVKCRTLIDLGSSHRPMYEVGYLHNCFSWSRRGTEPRPWQLLTKGHFHLLNQNQLLIYFIPFCCFLFCFNF